GPLAESREGARRPRRLDPRRQPRSVERLVGRYAEEAPQRRPRTAFPAAVRIHAAPGIRRTSRLVALLADAHVAPAKHYPPEGRCGVGSVVDPVAPDRRRAR